MMFSLNQQHIDQMRQFAQKYFPCLLQARPAYGHKGTFGTVGILGGASGMVGAPLLAGSAALLMGCGKVLVGFNQKTSPLQVYEKQPELMLRTAVDVLANPQISTWLIGCGLGRDKTALTLLQQVMLKAKSSFVIDADALYFMNDESLNSLQTFIITPHAAEAAHLLRTSSSWVDSHRIETVQMLTKRYRCITVLKGKNTLVADENGLLFTNPSGNVGLASAGTGDTLAGMIASLLAQDLSPQEASMAAVWLHGLAADFLAERMKGNIGIYASELPEVARYLRNQLVDQPTFFNSGCFLSL